MTINKKSLILIALGFVYVLVRLINIQVLPIFNDEALYLNWTRLIISNPAKYWDISLTDGQQLFFFLLTSISWLLGSKYFLLAGRLISVFSGLGALITLYFLGKELGNHKIGLLAALLYLISPFTLFYDRILMRDSFLMFLASLILLWTFKQFKTQKWQFALLNGVILGIALLTKSIAYFFVILYLLSVVILFISNRKKLKKSQLKTLILQSSTVLVVAFFIQALQYISSLTWNIGPKNSIFLLSFAELSKLPLSLWRNNVYSTLLWLLTYYQVPLLILFLFGFYLYAKKQTTSAIILLAWILLPISFEIITAKMYFPRYFLFTFVAFAILIAIGIDHLLNYVKNKFFQISLLILVLIPNLSLDYQLLFDVRHANLPQIEAWQYLEGWPSGYGFDELVTFINTNYLDKNIPIKIFTENETLLSSGLPLYLNKANLYQIEPAFELGKDLPQQLPISITQSTNKALILLHHNQEIPKTWNVAEVKRIPRGDPNQYFLVYQL
ncbi:phospholipid carrier-dependent glycosyltransferase [Candidatus Beckwithbacteria bacterium]|nr:phospholipid carrier-dependent glycosyltransferase [Candidatus Beckwithbacteria bacterium]